MEFDKTIILPKGWTLARLGDVCTLINGKVFKPGEWAANGLPIIRIQNLNDGEAEFNFCNFTVEDKYLVENGQLLFAWSGTPGTSFGAHIWNRGKAILNQHIFKIEINEKCVDKVYFKFALNYKVNEYISKAHGTAGLAHITKGKFEESLIPFPPYAEQKRIVAKIEALFAKLDGGVEALKNTKEQLRLYRQSVLKAAFEGRLTEEWRRANKSRVEPASVLLKRMGEERQRTVRDNGREVPPLDESELSDVPDGWCWARLEQISTKIVDGVHKKPNYVQNGIPFITVRNLRDCPEVS